MRWDTNLTLTELSGKWLESIASTIAPGTHDLYRMFFNTHLSPHFHDSPHEIQVAGIAEYGRRRLRVVKRRTIQKERSALRSFCAWCVEQGYLTDLQDFPVIPRRAIGASFAVRRRNKATEVSPEECRAIIARLPSWSRPRGDVPTFAIRDRFTVAYETALRPATLDKLSVPEHYTPGGDTVTISDAIDKARFGRVLPLTDAAREALGRVAKRGLIFGRHNYRRHLSKAAEKVLPPDRAATFCAYDLRHARLTELAEGGNLTGVAYLAGHRLVTTTSVYVRPGFRAAERALAPFAGPVANHGSCLTTGGNLNDSEGGAKKRGRTSTSFRTPEPEANSTSATSPDIKSLQHEAVEIAAAVAGGSVPHERLRVFARAALELSVVGRLALEILDGSPFSDLRAVELAQLILHERGLLQREEGSR